MAAAKRDRGERVQLRVKRPGQPVFVEEMDEDDAEFALGILLRANDRKPLDYLETARKMTGTRHKRWNKGEAKPRPEDFCPSGGKKKRRAKKAPRRAVR